LLYAPIHRYLDPVLSPQQRAEDLLSRVSLEDKAGQLFHSQIGMGPGGTLADADPTFGVPSTENLVLGRRMTHFNLLGGVEDSRLVAQTMAAGQLGKRGR
jgi:beta-glucosidase